MILAGFFHSKRSGHSLLALYTRSTGEDQQLAWQLLSLVAEENRLDLQRHLRRAIGQWSRAGKLTPALIKAVCSHTQEEQHLKVWYVPVGIGVGWIVRVR